MLPRPIYVNTEEELPMSTSVKGKREKVAPSQRGWNWKKKKRHIYEDSVVTAIKVVIMEEKD